MFIHNINEHITGLTKILLYVLESVKFGLLLFK